MVFIKKEKKGYKRQLIVIALCSLFSFCVFGQENNLVDSLLTVLNKSKNDTNKVILLNDLGWELKFDDPDKARIYLNLALVLADTLRFLKGQGDAFNYRGVVEDIHGNSELAITNFQKALSIRQNLGDEKGVASLYNNIGNVSENLGQFLNALENYEQSLELRKSLKDSTRMARLYYNISIVHERLGNLPEALDFILKYLETVQKTGDETGVANAFNIIGNIKTELERYPEAEDAYENALQLHRKLGNEWEVSSALNNIANLKDAIGEDRLEENLIDSTNAIFEEALRFQIEALTIREKLEDKHGIAEIYNNRGYVLKNLGSYFEMDDDQANAERNWQQAIVNFEKAETIRKEIDDQAGLMETYNGFGDVYRRQKKYQKALNYTQQFFDLSVKIGDKKFQQNALKDFARIYYQIGNYRLAYEYRRDYDRLRFQRFNQEQSELNLLKERDFAQRQVTQQKAEIEKQQDKLALQNAKLNEAVTLRNSLIGGALGLIMLLALLINRNRIKTKNNEVLAQKNKIIEEERHRAEELLLNILPKETADELKKNGKTQPVRYDSVTILFTDFESFTQIAEKLSPEDLVGELDKCFKAFDIIIEKYQIEKIKTIGDAYMCAGGLPTKNDAHALNVVKAAIEMHQFMENFNTNQKANGKTLFPIRMGIHTGPVVAGVVGSKKFAYDIWGDAVNMAARIEENSETGKINISKSTYELIKHQFDCEFRGAIDAKNKGKVEMYFVKTF